MGLLDGKVAFVTGGARGMGRSHALTLAREGADIVIADLCKQLKSVAYPGATPADLAETVAAIEGLDRRVVADEVDVRDQTALDALVERAIVELGGIDILIANQGAVQVGSFWEFSDEDWQEMIEVNLSGSWRAAKAVAPHMIERQSGVIVMTSSINGMEAGYNFAHYTAAKHGVIGLVKSIALELAPHGIRCNSVAPGLTMTPMNDYPAGLEMMAGGKPGATRDEALVGASYWALLKGRSALPPQSISNAVLFLSSDLSSDMTGQVVVVDAGHLTLPGYNHNPAV
jgi:SDR family mycofactocin-dependent oxidoreductase